MTGAAANPAVGLGLLAILIYTGYWIVRSRRRWRTILYSLLAIVVTLVVGILFAYFIPWMASAIGALIGVVGPLAMAITAAEHARFTIRRKKEQELGATMVNPEL